ncbi:MAG: T9SS type A sorting domain-containing protein, partial [Melioribacteraceae bacterium]|nr:T9SS type A sorting domain-containing protein [Melioribacteraceae bacterium]
NGSGLQSVKKDKMEEGEEWIAVMDYLDENRSLFLTRPIINDFDSDIKELSTTQILESGTPITVFSNGSAIIFVDVENNIKLIKTDGSDEHIISSNPAWYSVSISPDGSKLALITDNIEPYIYIADLDNPENGSKIRIYNPLSADTINDTTLQFADVLTWSADGGYIYYDCLVAEEEGSEYWTINLLDINNGDNIQLFELEDSMQVWGPSASNSGEYLLLDLYDSKTDSVTILLVDFNQDLPGIIEENGTSISNSRFSPLDDMVVFEYFDSLNGSIVPILSKIQLSEDKRIPASYSEQFVDSFRYPVWFIVGGIPVSVEIDETRTVTSKFSLSQNYPNPFNPTTAIRYSIPNINIGTSVQLKIYDVLGNEITTLVNEVQSPGNYIVNFDGSRLSSGIYYYQLKGDNFRESRKMLLLK